MKKLTVAIAGLGSRGGRTYAPAVKLYSDLMSLTAIADLNADNVSEIAKDFHIPKSHCFSSAESLLEQERLADALFICTQDRDHVRHAKLALEKGYHIL